MWPGMGSERGNRVVYDLFSREIYTFLFIERKCEKGESEGRKTDPKRLSTKWRNKEREKN